MIERIKVWWEQFFCAHPPWALLDRFRWEGEFRVYWQECDVCGKELYD